MDKIQLEKLLKDSFVPSSAIKESESTIEVLFPPDETDIFYLKNHGGKDKSGMEYNPKKSMQFEFTGERLVTINNGTEHDQLSIAYDSNGRVCEIKGNYGSKEFTEAFEYHENSVVSKRITEGWGIEKTVTKYNKDGLVIESCSENSHFVIEFLGEGKYITRWKKYTEGYTVDQEGRVYDPNKEILFDTKVKQGTQSNEALKSDILLKLRVHSEIPDYNYRRELKE